MRVFLTGATGYIGSAILDALLRGGHQVTALVRDPEKAERVAARGVQTVLGDLGTTAGYVAHAETCDGTIHAGFEPSKRGPDVDRVALDALIAAVRRRGAGAVERTPFFLYTSSAWAIGKAIRPASEKVLLKPTPLAAWRPAHEKLVTAAGADGRIRTAVVRPGVVYGRSRGIVADLIKEAKNGLIRVIGTGQQHWACVYDRDLADLYVRLAVSDEASGVFHANDEADERVEDIVTAIADHMAMRPDIRQVPLEEARNTMGLYADALALDQRMRSARARDLGWTPTRSSVAASVARLCEEYRDAKAAAA